MILFNTTYLVSPTVEKRFLYWLSAVYVPKAKGSGLVSDPRLFKVLTGESDGISYSLQILADNISKMNEFKKTYLETLEKDLASTFGESVLSFSTYLKGCEL